MKKLACPACGAPHEWPLPLPQAINCGNCKSTFSPVEELRRFTVYVCRPDENDTFLEVHHSSRPFMLPRRGDVIRCPFIRLEDGESLSVLSVEFEFLESAEGHAASEAAYLLTEIRKA